MRFPRQEQGSGFPFLSPQMFFFFKLFLIFGCVTWHVGSYFPDQGSYPCPLQWTLRVSTTWTAREVRNESFKKEFGGSPSSLLEQMVSRSGHGCVCSRPASPGPLPTPRCPDHTEHPLPCHPNEPSQVATKLSPSPRGTGRGACPSPGKWAS